MALLPVETVQAQLADELTAVEAWVDRRGCRFEYEPEVLRLRLWLTATNNEPYLLEGLFEDYPTLPPTWRFVHPDTAEHVGRPAYPVPPDPYPWGSPLIIEGGLEGVVICAHFNRLAFSEEGGPHGDWGPLANWRNPNSTSYTYADTIADMLARIALETEASSGRKAPLT